MSIEGMATSGDPNGHDARLALRANLSAARRAIVLESAARAPKATGLVPQC